MFQFAQDTELDVITDPVLGQRVHEHIKTLLRVAVI
jgi:hypothetical protein